MKNVVLVAAAVAGFAGAGQAAGAPAVSPVTGIVVSSERGFVLVAAPGGAVRATRGHAAIGARVVVRSRHITVVGRAHRAAVRGVVVRNRGRMTFLSAAGHLLVVRHGSGPATPRDGAPLPAPGTVVQSTVAIDDDGTLEVEHEDELGDAQIVRIQAPVTAVGAGTLTVTVDGQSLTLTLPAGLTLPASIVGSQVMLDVAFADDRREDDHDRDHAVTTTTTATTPAVTTTTMSGRDDHRGRGGDDGRHGGDHD